MRSSTRAPGRYRGQDRRSREAIEPARTPWFTAGAATIATLAAVATIHDATGHEADAGRLAVDLWLFAVAISGLLGLSAQRLWRASGNVRACRVCSAAWLIGLAAAFEVLPATSAPALLQAFVMLAAATAVIRTLVDTDVDTAARQPIEFLLHLGVVALLWALVLQLEPAGPADVTSTVVSAIALAAWVAAAIGSSLRAWRRDRPELSWVSSFVTAIVLAESLSLFAPPGDEGWNLAAAALTLGGLLLGLVGCMTAIADSALLRRSEVHSVVQDVEREGRVRASREQERAHEVRNLLLAVEVATETLHRHRDELSEDDHDHLVSTLAEELDGLRRLLQVERPSRPRHATDERFDLASVARRQVVLLQARGVDVELLPTPAVELSGDRHVASGVVANLLENAVRHGGGAQGGRVELELTVDPQHVYLSVTDSGPGIPRVSADAVFERGTRLNPHVEGEGLGLHVARRAVHDAGGQLCLEHPAGGGARFTVSFPLAITRQPASEVRPHGVLG